MRYNNVLGVVMVLSLLSMLCCKNEDTVSSEFVYIQPEYNDLRIISSGDSLTFNLDSNTFKYIKSFNYFISGGKEYISFYDKQSQSVNIYDFCQQQQIKRISLKEVFASQKLYKTTVYIKGLDSIFVLNNTFLYLLDSDGRIKDSIGYPNSPYLATASLDNLNPPTFLQNSLYLEARPRLNNMKKKDLKKWKVLYKFDLQSREARLYYCLPESYRNNIYCYSYFYNSYCYNNKGHFVFSFPADTNIYESDLNNYHHAYLGKSKFQNKLIAPLTADETKSGEAMTKSYLLNNSYGAIYFDPYRERYLRVARKCISEKAYNKREWEKKESLIVFDRNFKIIGESETEDNLNYSFLFFAKDGKMYTRKKVGDDRALHFVRVKYSDDNPVIQLAKK